MSNPSLHDTIDPHETLSRQEAHEAHVHVTPYWPMFWVFMVLLALTILTVWSSNIHHIQFGNTLIEFGGTAHILVAMTIAIIKAGLVAMYFMHLKYDSPMNTAVVGATIFAVILFIGLTLGDSATRDVMDPMQHKKVIEGGTSHMVRDPVTGEKTFVVGKGVVEAARENAHAAATNPTGEHAEGEPKDPAEDAAPPADKGKGGH